VVCSCGKTTIIESLKYAVTGSLPPGNQSGQAFVHDPKSMNQASVKANIKLRFTNRAGNPMVVVRSMEVLQKKTKMTFKALDGIIRTTDPETGNRVSLSHKCTELDRQIPQLMGVSKPILEHVVFCHQEDSSWPLQEGAVLKKRFDDIFDSTRYAKALEAIRKMRNEYNGVVKDLKADQAGLAAHKKAAEGFREELDASKAQLEDIDDTIANTDERIAAEEDDMKKFEKVLDEIADIKARRDEIDQQIEIAKATADSLLDACDENWTDKHTKEELEGMLATFDEQIEEDESQLRQANREYNQVQTDIDNLGEEKMRINAELAKCAAEREQHEKDLRQRQDHMERMGNEYELQLEGGSMTQGSYGSLTAGTFGTQQSTFSQGAGGGRPSLDSVATGRTGLTAMTQDTLVTISGDDMTAFLNAVSRKDSELRAEKEEFQQKAEEEQDDLVKKVSELQARLATLRVSC
jgi:DNA repair protein RAD50